MDERIPDGLTEIRRWTLIEIVDAHWVLDALDAAEARVRAKDS